MANMMDTTAGRLTVLTTIDEPNWEPIVVRLGAREVEEHWMWMYAATVPNGTRVDAYKHIASRDIDRCAQSARIG